MLRAHHNVLAVVVHVYAAGQVVEPHVPLLKLALQRLAHVDLTGSEQLVHPVLLVDD